MKTEDIADRRKLFELLTSIKNRAVSDNDRSLASIADETIDLWTRMVLTFIFPQNYSHLPSPFCKCYSAARSHYYICQEAATLAAAQEELVANKAQCVSLQAALNDANEELDALRRKLSETENKLAELEAAEDIVIQKKGPDKEAAPAGAMPNPKRSTAVEVSDEEGLEMWQGKNDSLNSHVSTVGSGHTNNIASLGPRGVQPSPLLGHSIESPPFGTMSRFDVPHGAWRGGELGMRMPNEVHGDWKQCVEYPSAPPQIPKQSPRSISHDISLHNGHAPTPLSAPRPYHQSPTNFISLLENPRDAIPQVEQAHGNWQPGIEYPAAPPFNFKKQMQSPERTVDFRRVPPAFEIKHQLVCSLLNLEMDSQIERDRQTETETTVEIKRCTCRPRRCL
jgi:hypothetical protein